MLGLILDLALMWLWDGRSAASGERRRDAIVPPGAARLSGVELDRRMNRWLAWGRGWSLDVALRERRLTGAVHGLPVAVRVRSEGDVALPIRVETRGPALLAVDVDRGPALAANPYALEGLDEGGRRWVAALFADHAGLDSLRVQNGRARLRLRWDAPPSDVDGCLARFASYDRDRAVTYRG
jgi:hypothetical protein